MQIYGGKAHRLLFRAIGEDLNNRDHCRMLNAMENRGAEKSREDTNTVIFTVSEAYFAVSALQEYAAREQQDASLLSQTNVKRAHELTRGILKSPSVAALFD